MSEPLEVREPPARSVRRPMIWAFGISQLTSVFQEIAPRYADEADIRLIEKGYADAAEMIEAAPPSSVDVIVAGGSNGAYLRSRVSVPVVVVNVTGFDVMNALSRARREHRRVALVTYGQTSLDFEQLDAAFDMQVEHVCYQDAGDARDKVQALRDAGITAVVGPGMVADLAEQAGLAGYFMYSPSSVDAVFDTALNIVRANRLEFDRRERLDAVLEHIHDGVLAMDSEGRIEAANPAMRAIFGVRAEALVGRRLSDVAPEFVGDEPVTARQQRVYTMGSTVYAVDAAPIVSRGARRGTVMTFQASQTVERLDRSLRSRRVSSHRAKFLLDDLIGSSRAMHELRALATRYARHDATVLLYGESGTGKEVIAQGMHNAGPRRAFPFVAINCGAFPETLLESELFGYEDGAFTGARRGGKTGLIEAAHGGTLFLDEIGEMPLLLQSRLLRVLQEREVLRLGASYPVPVDLRIIAASNRRLEDGVAQGTFRADLFFRLDILRINVPALRERPGDVTDLAQRLLAQACRRIGAVVNIEQALEPLLPALNAYDWPGNVRELENLVERLAIHLSDGSPSGALLEGERAALTALLPRRAYPALAAAAAPHDGTRALGFGDSIDADQSTHGQDALRRSRRVAEREAVARVLDECQGDRAAACARLGISRSTLWRKLAGA
ncbi:MAG: propionate catabolism operon regulatory protein PrpR [Janthinobacterium lividum]